MLKRQKDKSKHKWCSIKCFPWCLHQEPLMTEKATKEGIISSLQCESPKTMIRKTTKIYLVIHIEAKPETVWPHLLCSKNSLLDCRKLRGSTTLSPGSQSKNQLWRIQKTVDIVLLPWLSKYPNLLPIKNAKCYLHENVKPPLYSFNLGNLRKIQWLTWKVSQILKRKRFLIHQWWTWSPMIASWNKESSPLPLQLCRLLKRKSLL